MTGNNPISCKTRHNIKFIVIIKFKVRVIIKFKVRVIIKFKVRVIIKFNGQSSKFKVIMFKVQSNISSK